MYAAELIATGDELLSGETVDTNSSHIDSVLERHGWVVQRHQIVPDRLDVIVDALKEACTRTSVVVTTGGLGPTQDDLTFEAVARVMGVPLKEHEPTRQRIEAFFASIGRSVTDNNLRQALLPEGSEVLVNRLGTAPGIVVGIGSTQVFSLPGVPREMRRLLKDEVLPRIPEGGVVVRRIITVAGVGESALEDSLKSVIARHPEVKVGFRAKIYENNVKLVAYGDEAEARVLAVADEMKAVLGERWLSDGDQTLPGLIVPMLSKQGQTVGVAESCTGGWVAKMLTDISGSSAVFLGGVVAYADEVKQQLLGVSQTLLAERGAVSEEVARQMAEGVRVRLSTTWGLSTTGIAGPKGGTDDKPVGTVWIAIAGPSGTDTWRLDLGNRGREVVREMTVKVLLDRLRRRIES
ncbi:MAG: competence/damage-inducible protein A [Myxococcales bacterium]|nr:competence/damage-inducible protein A [Myxococcales bacterium]